MGFKRAANMLLAVSSIAIKIHRRGARVVFKRKRVAGLQVGVCVGGLTGLLHVCGGGHVGTTGELKRIVYH